MCEKKDWQEDPSLKNMNPDKMRFLTQMLGEMNGKDPSAILPFLTALSGSREGKQMSFNDSETDLILKVLMQRMTPEERSRIDMIRTLSRMIASGSAAK